MLRRPGGVFAVFVDEIKLYACAGDGGNGCISFRREKYVPRGGPDGGDGGDGGDVVVVCDGRRRTLSHLSHVNEVKAGRGGDGSGRKKRGARGRDIVVSVPPGSIIRSPETNCLIGEVFDPGDRLVIARGGRGGEGNVRFATAQDQAPRYATPGRSGEKLLIQIELKLLADVALVGYPNAGKSSLLAAMSGANPRVADYPFTTLAPQLGVVRVSPADEFTLVEVPGLIEGAHEGRGLGHDFLRHIERATVVALVIDAAAEVPNPASAYNTVVGELAKHNVDLVERIAVTIANKVDLPGTEEGVSELEGVSVTRVMAVSAATREGLDKLTELVYNKLK
jgi:GTP-binding protein